MEEDKQGINCKVKCEGSKIKARKQRERRSEKATASELQRGDPSPGCVISMWCNAKVSGQSWREGDSRVERKGSAQGQAGRGESINLSRKQKLQIWQLTVSWLQLITGYRGKKKRGVALERNVSILITEFSLLLEILKAMFWMYPLLQGYDRESRLQQMDQTHEQRLMGCTNEHFSGTQQLT